MLLLEFELIQWEKEKWTEWETFMGPFVLCWYIWRRQLSGNLRVAILVPSFAFFFCSCRMWWTFISLWLIDRGQRQISIWAYLVPGIVAFPGCKINKTGFLPYSPLIVKSKRNKTSHPNYGLWLFRFLSTPFLLGFRHQTNRESMNKSTSRYSYVIF
jgi:hypothetical protein